MVQHYMTGGRQHETSDIDSGRHVLQPLRELGGRRTEECGASGKVDLASNTVAIEYDENKVSLEALKEAIEEQGYDIVS